MTSENSPDSTASNQEERDIQADRDISAMWLRNLADRIEQGRARSVFCVFVEEGGSIHRNMVATFCPADQDAHEAALLYLWGKRALKRSVRKIVGDFACSTDEEVP